MAYNMSTFQPNLEFYMNNSPSEPDASQNMIEFCKGKTKNNNINVWCTFGQEASIFRQPDLVAPGDLIENILNNWKGDYKKLSNHCAYIQWLFPNKLQGKNPASYPLHEMEAELIRENPELKDRFKRAFEMMLDYFGMEFDETRKSFTLASNSAERLESINVWGSESFLYISRILLSLKECGFEQLMFPWMKFLAQLIYSDKTLDQAATSFEEFWMETLSDADQDEIRSILVDYQK